MSRDDENVRLKHMRDAARAAISFIQGRTREDLDSDLMLRYALVHAIGVIGEAAT